MSTYHLKKNMEKKRILFIDDDMTLGTIVALALNEAGYETHYQTSLTAITSVINELNPHLLLLCYQRTEPSPASAGRRNRKRRWHR